MVLKDVYIGLNCLVGCINIFLIFYLIYQMSQNFAHFVREFGIQNPIILDSLKFSISLHAAAVCRLLPWYFHCRDGDPVQCVANLQNLTNICKIFVRIKMNI